MKTIYKSINKFIWVIEVCTYIEYYKIHYKVLRVAHGSKWKSLSMHATREAARIILRQCKHNYGPMPMRISKFKRENIW